MITEKEFSTKMYKLIKLPIVLYQTKSLFINNQEKYIVSKTI